jgi:beta-glucosidase/6-phospho-beta-glucosidase/beta-galactosidase
MTKSQFLWGAATSSYQVEGGITNNDWDFFTRSEPIKNRISTLSKPSVFYKNSTQIVLKPAGDAVKFWDPKYYERDFELARSLGLNTFRIGIEWARIEPERGQWDQDAIEHYKEMIRAMRERSLMPVITLNHATLPLWVLTPPSNFTKRIGQNLLPPPLKDIPLGDPPSSDPYWKSLRGWENNETVEEFIKYVERIVLELKDQVDYWSTIGEPVTSIIGGGYIAGLWPPGFFLDGDRAKIVLHNLIEAHVQAYDKITSLDDIDADGDGLPNRAGFSHLMMEVIPAEPIKILGITTKDNTEAAKNFAYFVNDYFINAVINGEEDLNYLNTLQRKNKDSEDFIIHKDWKNKSDFIGLDYYRRVYIYSSNIVSLSSARFVGGAPINDLNVETNQPHGILNDLGWEIYPKGLYNLIMQIKTQWNKPVLITENGIADKCDRYRAPFIVAHLQEVKRAISNGADVFGYLHWSFMDNYEWLDNYKPEGKFGLFSIDRNIGDRNEQLDLIRQKTKGAEALELIIMKSLSQSIDGKITSFAIAEAENKFGTFTEDGSRIIHA